MKSGKIGSSYLSVGKKVKGLTKTITLISSERYRKKDKLKEENNNELMKWFDGIRRNFGKNQELN